MRLPTPGTIFEGKYEIIEPLGAGGFAAVLRARDVEIERDVAIKVLVPEQEGYGRRVVARFMTEARVIASLQDAHTIRLFEFGESADGLLYMVFQYVAGRDLSRLLKSEGALSAETAVHVAQQMLSALAEAHRADVLHRDIKPGNVLIHEYMGDPYTVKLLDFGIAKVDEAAGGAGLTKTGTLLGTPRYMAPEQVFGEPLSPTTDLYSVGLVLFEMLTGHPAMEGSQKEVLQQHAREAQHTVPPDVAWPALSAVIEKMLAHEPHQRYPSAQAASKALGAALSDRSTGAAYSTGPRAMASSGAFVTEAPATGEAAHSDGWRRSTAGRFDDSSRPSFERSSTQWSSTGSSGVPLTADEERASSGRWIIGIGLALCLGVALAAGVIFQRRSQSDQPSRKPALPDQLLEAQTPATTGASAIRFESEPVADTDTDAGVAADARAEAEVGPPVVVSGCGVERPWKKERWIEVPEIGRRGRVFLPREYDPEHRHPVILGFPPKYESEGGFASDANLRELTGRGAPVIVVIVSPLARFQPWEEGRADIEAARALLTTARKLFCVDETRVFAIGHHDGGRMARNLACEMPLAGLAFSGYAEKRGNTYCEAYPPVPTLWVIGRDDEFIPLGGGEGCTTGPFHSADDHDRIWRRRNGCEKESTIMSRDKHFECKVWDGQAAYASCRADGGHHLESTTWAMAFPYCSDDTLEFDVGSEAWRFFQKYGKPIPADDPRYAR